MTLTVTPPTPPDVAQAKEARRRLEQLGLLQGMPELMRRANEAYSMLKLLGVSLPTALHHEQPRAPSDDPLILKLRQRVHGKVSSKEEERIVASARNLLAQSDEYITSTDLAKLGMSPKTAWARFSGSADMKSGRPCRYRRTALLPYVVEEYWPRGYSARSSDRKG